METAEHFTASLVRPFPNCCTPDITQRVASSDWLCSRCGVHLRLFHGPEHFFHTHRLMSTLSFWNWNIITQFSFFATLTWNPSLILGIREPIGGGALPLGRLFPLLSAFASCLWFFRVGPYEVCLSHAMALVLPFSRSCLDGHGDALCVLNISLQDGDRWTESQQIKMQRTSDCLYPGLTSTTWLPYLRLGIIEQEAAETS